MGLGGQKLSQTPDSFLSQIEFVNVPLRASNAWIPFLFQKTGNRPFAGLIHPAFRKSARAVVSPGDAQACPLVGPR